MKVKCLIFAVLAVFFTLVINPTSQAIDTRQIDTVLQKGVLDSQDLQAIDDFVGEAVQELVNTRDFTNIAKNRTVILSRRSDQGQYSQQFSESTHKHISLVLQEASRLTPEDRKLIVTVNLLILIDGLEDPRLANLAISKLTDKSEIIRYWAVHCLTSPGIITKLNSEEASNLKLARNIAKELTKVVAISSPETIALIAKFTADINIQESEDVLLQIADMRIKSYADWTVEYELLDGFILKSLNSKIASASSNKSTLARRFCQLYSYVIQRYIKGRELLSDTQRQQLASVMIETEDKCISKLLGKTQTVIKRAIEADSIMTVLREHDRLLGAEAEAGQLPSKLNFKYGSTSGSSSAPIPLPEPPKAKSEF